MAQRSETCLHEERKAHVKFKWNKVIFHSFPKCCDMPPVVLQKWNAFSQKACATPYCCDYWWTVLLPTTCACHKEQSCILMQRGWPRPNPISGAPESKVVHPCDSHPAADRASVALRCRRWMPGVSETSGVGDRQSTHPATQGCRRRPPRGISLQAARVVCVHRSLPAPTVPPASIDSTGDQLIPTHGFYPRPPPAALRKNFLHLRCMWYHFVSPVWRDQARVQRQISSFACSALEWSAAIFEYSLLPGSPL